MKISPFRTQVVGDDASVRSVDHLRKIRRTGLPVVVALMATILLLTSVASGAASGTILGQLADGKGRVTHVGNAVVFLCDAESGLPILKSTRKSLDLGSRLESVTDFWHSVTSDESVFEFRDVPVGRYRLVAQSWTGIQGMPDPDSTPSVVVVLHGVADNVEVRGNEVTRVYPRKLGDGVLKIVNDPEEAHAFLVVSRKPRLGDGVLGPVAWGKDFLSDVIAVTRMEQPYVTLVGLPDGAQIHVGLMNYDNSPGVGGDSYVVGKERVVRLPIFATWSNGKHEPPERLSKLTRHMEENDLSASKLLGLEGSDSKNAEALANSLRQESDRLIQVDGIGKFRLADVLAASKYRSLREAHRARRTK